MIATVTDDDWWCLGEREGVRGREWRAVGDEATTRGSRGKRGCVTVTEALLVVLLLVTTTGRPTGLDSSSLSKPRRLVRRPDLGGGRASHQCVPAVCDGRRTVPLSR